MSERFLSDEERLRFALYLEREVSDLTAVLEPMERLPGMEAMVRHTKIRAAAYRLVANELRNTEAVVFRSDPEE